MAKRQHTHHDDPDACCPGCAETVLETWTFCSACGHRLASDDDDDPLGIDDPDRAAGLGDCDEDDYDDGR